MNNNAEDQTLLATKRTYACPQLKVFGGLSELTATGSAGSNEAASRLCTDVVPAQKFNINCM